MEPKCPEIAETRATPGNRNAIDCQTDLTAAHACSRRPQGAGCICPFQDGIDSIVTTAITTATPSPGQARVDPVTVHTTRVGMTRPVSWGFFVAACAPPRNIALTIWARQRMNHLSACSLPVARELCQCHSRQPVLQSPSRSLSSGNGAVLLSGRQCPPLPPSDGTRVPGGPAAAVRMGGAETNRRSPLLHATPVLLSPSQGCIPAWDDEEVPPQLFPS